jgi:type VI secretion system protein ImpH
MAAQDRTQDAGVRQQALYARLAAQPQAFDFYQALRRIEALHRGLPRIGDAVRPAEEAVRLAQEASLTFAPANLSAFEQPTRGKPRLVSRFLGLFGPQGALPTHLTELARQRQRSYGDPTLARFVDLFHHRLLSMFYKAWRQAQPTAAHDRPEQDRFNTYLDALYGGLPERDCLQSHAKRHFAGHLGRQARNACGLEDILSRYFGVAIELMPFHPRWMPLPPDQRSSLRSKGNNCLGRNLVVGSRIFDAQHHFLLRIGPLTLAQYEAMLPGTLSTLRLRDWVRLYTDRQFGWRAQLLLERGEVPPPRLGRHVRLGWTSWLGMPPAPDAAAGHLLDPERSMPAAETSPPAKDTSTQTPQQEEPCLK